MVSGVLDDKFPAQRVIVSKRSRLIRRKRGSFRVSVYRWYKPWQWWPRFEHWRFERKYF